MKNLTLLLLLIASIVMPVQPVSAQDFPVTVTHAFGETTIAAKPERIAVIGWMAQDVVLALGEVPVGVPVQNWGGDENGLLPWDSAAIAALGGALPTRYDDTQVPFEQILALAPDLILAPYSGLTRADYDRLSQIAPTVGWSSSAWSGSWQAVTLTVGKALGQSAAAQALVDVTEADLAAIATAHPEFAGKTFTFGWPDLAQASFGVYVGSDSRVQLLEDLGLELAPGAAALSGQGFFVPVSFERLDTLDADVLITWQADQAELDALLDSPLFARFAPVAQGNMIAMLDHSFVMATSAPSVLSIPWAMERLVPELAGVLTQ